jgi:adenine-specific DNA methylase
MITRLRARWGNVLRELPKRVGDWMERLQSEGVRGADLVFACIGPALEIYSRYSKVVDAEEREIPLGGVIPKRRNLANAATSLTSGRPSVVPHSNRCWAALRLARATVLRVRSKRTHG